MRPQPQPARPARPSVALPIEQDFVEDIPLRLDSIVGPQRSQDSRKQRSERFEVDRNEDARKTDLEKAPIPQKLSGHYVHHLHSDVRKISQNRGDCPVYLLRTGIQDVHSHARFRELLALLAEEHEKILDQCRETLLTENSKLREDLSKVRRSLHQMTAGVEPEACHKAASERIAASTTSKAFPRWTAGRQTEQGPQGDRGSVAMSERGPSFIASERTQTSIQSERMHSSMPSSRGSLADSEEDLELHRSQLIAATKTAGVTLRRHVTDGEATQRLGDDIVDQPLDMRTRHAMTDGASRRDRCMVSPVSRTRLTWDFVAFTCLLVDLWMTPVELVFMSGVSVPVGFSVVNLAIIFFFAADIVLNFNTGFIAKDKLVLQRWPSIQRYMVCWFWIDLVATVPFDLLITMILRSFDGEVLSMARLTRLTKVTKVLKTLRFLKMARAIRIVSSMGRADSFVDMIQPIKYMLRVFQLGTALCFIAHLHGCLWALLQEDLVQNGDVALAMRNYYLSFRWAFNAITAGVMEPATNENPGVWTLEMFISVERILIVFCLGGWGIVKALTIFQEDAQLNIVKSAAVRFFRQHQVSIETQISVMYSLHETNDAQTMQRHFKNLMSEHLPDELRRAVSEELWVRHLCSLGLIKQMKRWHEDFLPELSLLVREEVVASKTVLCKEGHASIAAYYILKGRLEVAYSHTQGFVPDFLDGMWVEEIALVSPIRRRSSTIVTAVLSRLMTVPTQSFHDLIISLGLDVRFQEFKETHLARGLCGRCGELGDHFTHACPQANNPGVAVKSKRRQTGQSRTVVLHNSEGSLSLSAFLHAHRINDLAPILQDEMIYSRADLEDLDFDRLYSMYANDVDIRRQFQLLHALVKESQEERAFNVNTEQAAAQHLAFLSHYKLEAGTEAALMRQELERVLSEDSQSPARNFQVPIFLDSEDLSDLEELEAHVRRSHNLVLVLTKDVLTRPWVLVEIVTATEKDVRLVPVEVNKKGAGFTFPDEEYYAKLLAGKVLDSDSQALLAERGIRLHDVERALRDVFNKIALPYSPHRSESIRMAEIKAIYKQLLFRDMV